MKIEIESYRLGLRLRFGLGLCLRFGLRLDGHRQLDSHILIKNATKIIALAKHRCQFATTSSTYQKNNSCKMSNPKIKTMVTMKQIETNVDIFKKCT